MFFLYIIVAVVGILVCMFFLTRSIIILISFLTKSPFVPSENVLMKRALEHLSVDSGDRFLDIGCGDGRVVFNCAKNYPNGQYYKGIEIMSFLVFVAKLKQLFVENREKISIERKNVENFSFKEYNKVFMYLFPEFVDELMPRLQKELPSGAVVVSVDFKISETYEKFGSLKVDDVKVGFKKKKIYIWKKK